MDELKIKINADIKIPMVPNFIQIRTRKGFDDFNQSIAISDFTDDELREIGEKWIDKLIEHAQALRNNKIQ